MAGILLSLAIGPTVPAPALPELIESLESVEITHNDEGRSGFQLSFHLGRSGPAQLQDYQWFTNPLLQPFNRVILQVTLGALPRVLMDGIITQQQFAPSNSPGESTLTVTGEDISIMMDLEEKRVPHPAMPDEAVVGVILATYARYGLVPTIIPPKTTDVPTPDDRTPTQQGTDLGHIQKLAERHGHVFYVTPGPASGANLAYWGPPVREDAPQRALSYNMGPDTNVDSISFQFNALEPTLFKLQYQDRKTNEQATAEAASSDRRPLSATPAIVAYSAFVRKKYAPDAQGLTSEQALARVQAETNKSTDRVVTASGELNALRYGDLLKPRTLVDVRGVGYMHDGTCYVKSVPHSIRRGEYKQKFTLAREGHGAISPVVIP